MCVSMPATLIKGKNPVDLHYLLSKRGKNTFSSSVVERFQVSEGMNRYFFLSREKGEIKEILQAPKESSFFT